MSIPLSYRVCVVSSVQLQYVESGDNSMSWRSPTYCIDQALQNLVVYRLVGWPQTGESAVRSRTGDMGERVRTLERVSICSIEILYGFYVMCLLSGFYSQCVSTVSCTDQRYIDWYVLWS